MQAPVLAEIPSLILVVHPDKQDVTLEGGTSVVAHRLYVDDGSTFMPLLQWSRGPWLWLVDMRKITKIRILYWEEKDEVLQPADLPLAETVHAALITFLRHQYPDPDPSFGWYSFINLVSRVEMHAPEHWRTYWWARSFRHPPPRNSVIFMLDEAHMICHASVYLERGYYLCISSNGPEIYVTELGHMIEAFPETRAVRAIVLTKPHKSVHAAA